MMARELNVSLTYSKPGSLGLCSCDVVHGRGDGDGILTSFQASDGMGESRTGRVIVYHIHYRITVISTMKKN